MGRKNVNAVRGQLLYTPNSDLKITLQGEVVTARNGAPVVVNGGLPGEANYVPAGTDWNGSVLPTTRARAVPNEPCKAPDQYFSGNNEVPDKSDMTTRFGIATIQYNNTPLGDITAITGYKNFTLFEYTDQDGTAKTNNATRRRTHGWQFSQEIRSAFNVGESFNAVAGLFFLKTNYHHYQMYHLDFALPGLIQYNVQDQGTKSFSAFLQTYTKLAEGLKLSAGVRYTHDSIDARSTLDLGFGSEALTSPNWDKFDVKFPGSLDVGGKKSWNNVGWKLGLDYQIGQNQMIYASWARGFKSGGFTGRIGVAADGDTPYGPEKVDTFEVGLKADFLDRHLRVNLAAFTTNYRDMQVAQIYFDPKTNVQGNRILNAAASRIKGFELEMAGDPGRRSHSARLARLPRCEVQGLPLLRSGKRELYPAQGLRPAERPALGLDAGRQLYLQAGRRIADRGGRKLALHGEEVLHRRDRHAALDRAADLLPRRAAHLLRSG
jgi:iron complex outermembrane receptor protein